MSSTPLTTSKNAASPDLESQNHSTTDAFQENPLNAVPPPPYSNAIILPSQTRKRWMDKMFRHAS